jgi:hypothetical protein
MSIQSTTEVSPEETAIKRCSCGVLWKTYENLIDDPCVSLLGFQPGPDECEGAYLFNHTVCGNTIALHEAVVRECEQVA